MFLNDAPGFPAMAKGEQTMLHTTTARPRAFSLAGQRALLVQMAVAEVTGVDLARICGPGRGDCQAALARQMAIYLCRLLYAMSLTELGEAFGRDRTTASHAVQRIEDLREDPELDRTLSWLEASLRRAGART